MIRARLSSAGGVLRVVSCAVATLLGACADASGTASLSLGDPMKLLISPAVTTIHAGEKLPVVVRTSTGAGLDTTVQWTTDDPRVARVVGDTIFGYAEGSTTLRAMSGSRTAQLDVTVPADLALREFVSPLAADAPVANVFDHDVPREFNNPSPNGFLLSFWGEIFDPGADGHNGYDWSMATGTPVYAAGPGTVTFAGFETPFVCPFLNNNVVSGLWVTVAHAVQGGELIYTQYGHFSRVDVKAGDRVRAGQQLGVSGMTGCAPFPHLHFSTYRMRGRESFARTAPTTGVRVMDPYGWTATTSDPWVSDTGGVESVAIWQPLKAPKLYGEIRVFSPARVVPYLIRYWGVDDETVPNNEYIGLAANGSAADLTGWTLRNRAGDTYAFPSGSTATAKSTLFVHTGSGANTTFDQYWGRAHGAWGNRGDCLELRDAAGALVFSTYWGAATCGPSAIGADAERRRGDRATSG
jgi:murein DD-endopeptidase MepM/ murein hydrolase activator NlpD